MVFHARILRGTPIWRLWREHSRVSGIVGGAHFRWVPGGEYATEALTAEQVGRLRANNSVAIEVTGHGAPVAPSPAAEMPHGTQAATADPTPLPAAEFVPPPAPPAVAVTERPAYGSRPIPPSQYGKIHGNGGHKRRR